MLAILYLLPTNPTLSLTPSPLIRLQASTPKASLIYKLFTSPDLFRDKLKIELQWEADLGYAWPVTFGIKCGPEYLTFLHQPPLPNLCPFSTTDYITLHLLLPNSPTQMILPVGLVII